MVERPLEIGDVVAVDVEPLHLVELHLVGRVDGLVPVDAPRTDPDRRREPLHRAHLDGRRVRAEERASCR